LLNDLSYDLTDELRRLKTLAETPVIKSLITKTAIDNLAAGQFDVFLCHNSKDKPAVKQIGEQLKASGLRPWLDEWELRPGVFWGKELDKQIKHIKAAAVFIGSDGIGPWQDMEIDAFLRRFVKQGSPAIPVILPGCQETPELPVFLEGMTWVDFRKADPDPLAQLIWGITGERAQIKTDTRQTVFLAEATDDLDALREEVKRYLLQANLRVLPETYYPPDPAAFQQAVRADLGKSDVFVQLLSALPGKRPPTLPQGYVRCQSDLAQAAHKPILQWRSPSLNLNEIADAAQQDFLRGHTVFAVGLEEFKAQIVKVITAPPEEPQPPVPKAGSLIFIDTDLNDASLSTEICQTLERLGAGYALPLREGKPSEVREAFKQFVLYADTLMIICGDVTPNWVIAQGLEIKKYLAQRETPPKAFVIYEGPPAPKSPIPLKFPGMRVIECRQSVNEQKLREVIEAL
jgi:hypothetical protein